MKTDPSEYRKPGHDSFYAMVQPYEFCARYWKPVLGGYALDDNAAEKAFGFLSSGEAHMLKFFISVWFGGNDRWPFTKVVVDRNGNEVLSENREPLKVYTVEPFDLADAASTLDFELNSVIRNWMNHPFYP